MDREQAAALGYARVTREVELALQQD